MKNKNWRKHSSLALSALLLFNTVTPLAAPLVSHASSEEVVELVLPINESAISVGDAIALGNDTTEQSVSGYIVGYALSKTSVIREDFPEDHNVAIADDPNETDVSKMVFVQIPNGTFRAEIGLKSNPGNLGKKITVTGNLEGYVSSHNGIKKVKDISIEEVEEVETGMSVADAIVFNNDKTIQEVTGYIVGYTIGANNVSRDDFREDWNVAIADDPSETDFEKMLIVQLPSQFRGQFGLKTNPDMLGKKMTVTGTLDKYHGGFGLKDPTAMEGDLADQEPVELITIADARAQKTGRAKVKGTVTAKLNNTIHIQDETAGIALRPTSLDVEIGDVVTVTGNLLDYNNLLQLDGASLDQKEAGTVLDATIIKGSELASHQSKLISVENVEVTKADKGDGWANYTVKDVDGTVFTIRDEKDSLFIEEGYSYASVTGISSQFGDTLQIIPRDLTDLIADESVVQKPYASSIGLVPEGSKVELATRTPEAKIYYTLDGTTPTKESTLYTESIVIDKELTIKTIAIKGDKVSEVASYDYTVYDAADGIRIHDIQGEGHWSPLEGSRVEEVEGIVTYKYDIRGAHYFHMQTPEAHYDGNPNTSEGIVVYTGRAANVEIGDLINVSGQVSEYQIDGYNDKEKTDLPITQINARDDRGGVIAVIEKGVELPAPIKIISSDLPGEIASPKGFDEYNPEKYSMDFWESIEGMRVEIEESASTSPQQHGDLVVTTNEYEPVDKGGNSLRTLNGGVRLTENGPDSRLINISVQPNGPARNLKIKTGDKFTAPLQGVVNYGFGSYKVYTDLADLTAAHEEVEHPTPEEFMKDEEKLTVAAYNVENYSANTSANETPVRKSQRIAEAFVKDMKSPDIIALIEVMSNDGSVSATAEAAKSYERLIGDIAKAGGPTYKFVNIDPVYNADGGKPTGNIRVGYLYNPDRVGFDEYTVDGVDLKNDPVEYKDGKLTTNPGRVSPDVYAKTRKPLAAQFTFNGETVVILNNHLNSKLGDVSEYGQIQPAVKGSEAQRIELATEQNRFVKEIKADNPGENVIVLGDMNDFEFSAPLQALKGEELTNMIEKLPAERRYSYVYNGNSQVLDHILVSNNIADRTEIDVMNVNADYTDMHGRASDHNPLLVQVDLTATEEPTDFTLPIMHLNDTHANVENYPYITTLVKNYREVNPESLLLHGGDVFSGTLYFNKFKGQADVALLNEIGIDAMVFGNHEFDLGQKENGHESLAKFVDKANFPMLGANSDFSKDPFLKKYEPKKSGVEDAEAGNAYNSIVVEREGEKIGIFGLTTEDTKNIASPMSVTFSNYIETAKKEIAELEKAGIDKIIAVTHIGHNSAPAVGNDLLLAKNVDGIDVVVGGHSHTKVEPPVLVEKEGKASTVVVQAGQYAENLGTVKVTFNDSGEVIDHVGELLPIEVDRKKVVEPDAKSLELLAPFKEEVDKLANTETGAVAMKDLVNPRLSKDSDVTVRGNETALGNLVADAMLAKSKEKEADIVIAVQNGGGIRTSIPKGPITNGQVISVLPFGNNPVVVELSGAEIKEILEHAVHHDPGTENGGFLHIAGMKYYYDSTKEAGNRVVKMLVVAEDGTETEINLSANYKITTNGFTGQGGDGFETFVKASKDGRVRDLGEEDWQQLVDYMVEEEYLGGVVDPEIEGRIVDLKGEALPEPGIKIGWIKDGSNWYYYDDNGVMKTGWEKVNGTWYYMSSSGVMQTGWNKVGNTWYYMTKSGAMQTGWNKVGNIWYYMTKSGGMQTGWNKVDNTWYYMTSNGAMQTGWNKVNNTWYYMTSNGAMQTGWSKVGNTWYYMTSNGAMQTGWNKVGNTWYYMTSNGAMQTGWNKVGPTWYYMNDSGAMQTGWNKIGPTWYYMNDSGAMQTGWIKLGSNWYFLNTDGSMQKTTTSINGRTYRFHSSGRML